MDFSIVVSVRFYAKKRKVPPILVNEKYSPHLVVKGDEEYLGVNFIVGPEKVSFDEDTEAVVLPLYEGVDYSKLSVGKHFFIMEGAQKIGEGVVKEIFLHRKGKR